MAPMLYMFIHSRQRCFLHTNQRESPLNKNTSLSVSLYPFACSALDVYSICDAGRTTQRYSKMAISASHNWTHFLKTMPSAFSRLDVFWGSHLFGPNGRHIGGNTCNFPCRFIGESLVILLSQFLESLGNRRYQRSFVDDEFSIYLLSQFYFSPFVPPKASNRGFYFSPGLLFSASDR